MAPDERVLICPNCGKTEILTKFQGTQKTCKQCSAERARAKERERSAEKRKTTSGTLTMVCKMCGAETERHSPGQRYCPECGETRRKMSQRSRRKLDEAVEYINTAFAKCTVIRRSSTFDVKGKDIAQLNAEARAFGLNYGRYVSMCECGEIVDYLRASGIDDPEDALKNLPI